MVVGHLHMVAGNGVGNRHRRMFHLGFADADKVLRHRIDDARIIFAGQHLHLLEMLRRGFQCETRVRAADVGNQARPEAV